MEQTSLLTWFPDTCMRNASMRSHRGKAFDVGRTLQLLQEHVTHTHTHTHTLSHSLTHTHLYHCLRSLCSSLFLSLSICISFLLSVTHCLHLFCSLFTSRAPAVSSSTWSSSVDMPLFYSYIIYLFIRFYTLSFLTLCLSPWFSLSRVDSTLHVSIYPLFSIPLFLYYSSLSLSLFLLSMRHQPVESF